MQISITENVTCENIERELGLPVLQITQGVLDEEAFITGVSVRIQGTEAEITEERKAILKNYFGGQRIVVELVS